MVKRAFLNIIYNLLYGILASDFFSLRKLNMKMEA